MRRIRQRVTMTLPRRGATVATAGLLLFGWAAAGTAQDRPEKRVPIQGVQPDFRVPAGPAQYVEGRVIVKYRFGVSDARRSAIHADLGGQVVKRFHIIDAEVVELPKELPVEFAVDWYSARADVEYAEPDYLVYALEPVAQDIGPALTPDDPRYPEMYGLNNTGQTGGTPDADIDAPEAWDVQTGSSDVIIGVIDTGVDWDHEDLAGNIWTNAGETPDDGIDNDNNGYVDDVHGYDFVNNDGDPDDDNAHGTHVSGTIAAVGDNATGTTGVAWDAQIMGLKFLNSGGSGSTSDAIEAVQYATDMGAHLTNNSWGGGGFSQALRDAIEASGDAGMLFMAAAGNNSRDTDAVPHYPSSYTLENIISVAATDHNDALAGFSNFGATSVDVGAPGASILSTTPNDGYSVFSGTSMATPHVAGLAALIKSQFPGLSHMEIRNRIFLSGDPVDALEVITTQGRRINAANALEEDDTPPNAVTDLEVVPDAEGPGAAGLTSLRLSWTATGDDGATGNASSYDVRYSIAPIDDANFDAATPATGEPDPAAPGELEFFTVTGLDFATTYFFAVKVRDNVGNSSGVSNSPSGTTAQAKVLFEDDAETDESDDKWTADPPWARTTEDASPDGGQPGTKGGIYSWTDSPGSDYANNLNIGIVSIPFSLENENSALLVFDHIHEIETFFDSAHVDISTDGGASWSNLEMYTGTIGSWETVNISLDDYVGAPDVRLRFRLVTDFSVTFDGWHVDDIQVLTEQSTALSADGSDETLGDPAILNIELANQDPVGGVDYELSIDDPRSLLTYVGGSTTARTTGFDVNDDYDAGTGTLTGLLIDTQGGSAIEPGDGAIVEHEFSSEAPADIADIPVSDVTVDAPADPDDGMPRIFFDIPVTVTDFNISDASGNPVVAVAEDGSIELALLNTDVDFSTEVDVADVVAMIDFFLDRIAFTELQFLVADAYKDDEINVVDVVRAVNIIFDRPIGDDASTDLVAFGDRSDGPIAESSRRVHFSLEQAFARLPDDRGTWIDLVADVPENVAGMQITVGYDPSRVNVLGESLQLDERQYRLATRRDAGEMTLMIYSLNNAKIEPGARSLVRLRVEPVGEGPDARTASAPIDAFEFTRALAVDPAGGSIATNVSSVPQAREILDFGLGTNYPNPFTPSTGMNIEIAVPTDDNGNVDKHVSLQIYTMRGRLVRTLENDRLAGGQYTYSWDGRNDRGELVSSGIYLLLMKTDDFVERRRIVFVR